MTVPGPHPRSPETEPEGGWSRQLHFPPAPGRSFSVQCSFSASEPAPGREAEELACPVPSEENCDVPVGQGGRRARRASCGTYVWALLSVQCDSQSGGDVLKVSLCEGIGDCFSH